MNTPSSTPFYPVSEASLMENIPPAFTALAADILKRIPRVFPDLPSHLVSFEKKAMIEWMNENVDPDSVPHVIPSSKKATLQERENLLEAICRLRHQAALRVDGMSEYEQDAMDNLAAATNWRDQSADGLAVVRDVFETVRSISSHSN